MTDPATGRSLGHRIDSESTGRDPHSSYTHPDSTAQGQMAAVLVDAQGVIRPK